MPERRGHAVVVPCYNEAERLDVEGFLDLLEFAGRLLFVDDGSTDGTPQLLRDAAARHDDVGVLTLPRNRGKGEAIRQGLSAAIGGGADTVGFLDADLATSVMGYRSLCDHLDRHDDLDGVIGARVALLGHQIERHRARHYLGRVFATAASFVLAREVYDTQCGAKVFRATPVVVRALDAPFLDRWSFDVELLGRIFVAGGDIHEVPLAQWTERGGSSLGVADSIRSASSLLRVRRRLARYGNAAG